MRRGFFSALVSFVFLASAGCGARTEPVDEFAVASRGLDGGDGTEADTGEVPDSASQVCPLTPPSATVACENASATLCAYVGGSIEGIEAWCCEFGGWSNCTTVADTFFATCAAIGCAPGVVVECIVGGGEECCTCSPDGAADRCGPC